MSPEATMAGASREPAAGTRPGAWTIWWLAARPKTLPAAAAPVLVGTACAFSVDRLFWPAALASLIGALLLQIAANFANDLFDFEKGADTEQRVGPTRAVQAGWLTPSAMRRGLAVVLALALVVGVYLVGHAGPLLLAVGLGSIAAAIAYTGGPYPLGYHGLGDVCVFLFFGLVAVPCTAFVQTGFVPALAWWLAVPLGSLTTAILVVNNVRDRETDARAGKRTVVVRFGRRFGVVEYAALLALAYAVALYLAATRQPWLLLTFVTLPRAFALVRTVQESEGAVLNACLAKTAQLLFVFSLLASVGVVLERVV